MGCRICDNFHFQFCKRHLQIDRAARCAYFLGVLFFKEQERVLHGIAVVRDATELIGCIEDYPQRWWDGEVSGEMVASLCSSSLTIFSLAHQWNLMDLGKYAYRMGTIAGVCSGISYGLQAREKKGLAQADRLLDSLFFFADALEINEEIGIVTGAWGAWAATARESYCHG